MKSPHVADLLPAYLVGTLDAREELRVREHLEVCDGCRSELSSWQATRGAALDAGQPIPTPSAGVMEGVLARIGAEEPVASPPLYARLSLAWQLLVGQLPLVRREIWAASAVTMAMGCLVAALTATDASVAGSAFAVFAPIIAAVGVAFVYGPENDPSLEVALSTPTSPRLVLLARLVLVYGYDLALALAATAALATAKGTFGLWPLVSLWVGPMFFLSALALLVSLLVSPTPAVLVALSLWGLRLLAAGPAPDGETSAWAEAIGALWHAESLLIPLAAALLLVAFLYAPRAARTRLGGPV